MAGAKTAGIEQSGNRYLDGPINLVIEQLNSGVASMAMTLQAKSPMHFRTFEGRHAFSLTLAIVCLYLILSPVWMPGIAPRLYDDSRYLELTVLALLLIPLARSSVRDAVTLAWLSLDKKARTLLVVLLAGGALSAAVSDAAHLGSMEVALVAQLVLLTLMVSAAVRESAREADNALVIAIFAGAALCVLKFWVTYALYALEGKIFPWDSPFLEFANVRFFSQYQSYTLLLMILPGLIPGVGKSARALFFFVAANFWALHWMVGTRAAWLGLMVGSVVVVVFMRRGRMVWLREQMLVAFAGAAIFLAHSQIVASLPHIAAVPGIKSIVDRGQGSINERLELAQGALGILREHPLVGVGPGQFGLQPYSTYAAHPHNVPLQLLSEYGLPAGLAGIALVLMLTVYAVRTLRKASGQSTVLDVSLVAALIMGLADSLFSGNLIMPHSQMLFAVLAGWIIGRTVRAPSGLYQNASGFKRLRFTIVSIAILAVAITTILGLEYLPLARDIPVWLLTWNPHFWQYGRFSAW
jgi:O-antigen ligase